MTSVKGAATITDEPVKGFPIRFKWQTGLIFDLFQRQVEQIKLDIARARVEDRLIVYLSCPISSRGGGYATTNVEIALHTQNRLQRTMGERFWFLNPSQYQMESKEGTGLMLWHAQALVAERKLKLKKGETVKKMVSELSPTGSDYMRMWTRVLVEDDQTSNAVLSVNENPNGTYNYNISAPEPIFMGGHFSAYYFVGMSDAEDFFKESGAQTITAGVEDYFTRKYATDSLFRTYFTPTGRNAEKIWRKLRQDFFRFYSSRYSANYSSGSHDEWNIWCKLNRLRLEKLGVGSQIAGYFDGKQIDLAASETFVSRGYSVE